MKKEGKDRGILDLLMYIDLGSIFCPTRIYFTQGGEDTKRHRVKKKETKMKT